MPKKQNPFANGLRMVRDTFAAYGQRFVPLALFSLVLYGTIIFTVTYVADSLLAFIRNIADNPTLSNMEAMPVQQVLVLMIVLMFVLPLAMGGLLLLSPPGQDVMTEGDLDSRGFHSVSATMAYLRSQYKLIFVSCISFFILLFIFYTLFQYILALFFMRFDAALLNQVTGILLIAAGVFILPLSGLVICVCLFEKSMGFSAVRRAISMVRTNLGSYLVICVLITLITLGSSYLANWAALTYLIPESGKIEQFAVSSAWQALVIPLSYLSMLLFYRRTLSLHDINVLFPN